jgi:parvulin-like peptidyl-prolyl isomerase
MMKKKKSKLAKLSVPKIKVPKKLPRLRVPKQLRGQQKQADAKLVEAIQNLPRITNETVAEHREEVLSSARKYIYPLSHSKRRVVLITSGLLASAIVLFFGFCTLELYKFRSDSTFMYGVTQVIPFPVAKAGSSWVSYDSYLFELRHTVHYYQVQQKEDFSTKAGKQHLATIEKNALDQVIQDAYVKQLASKYHISVSDQEVANQINLVRSENRLGSSDQVFKNVLSEFWGWTITDFQRELKQQLLTQKVVAKLDTTTQARAQNALDQLNKGVDFATLATSVSDDQSTKANGGNYGFEIDPSNHNIDPRVTQELFKLTAGQYSGIINTGYALEIDKVLSVDGGKVQAAHIVFNFQDISVYVNPLESAHKPHKYITIQQ